jgi:hypothetical protein
MMLFGSLFTDILAFFGVLEHTFLDDGVEGEPFDGSDVETNLGRDLVPMSVDHTLLTEGAGHWHNWLELIDLLLHDLGDVLDLWQVLTLKESESGSDGLHALLKGRVELIWVDFIPGTGGPGLVSHVPCPGVEPQIRVGLELLGHSSEPCIIFLLLADEILSGVE